MKGLMDLFGKLSMELKDLFKDLFKPGKEAVILSKMEDVLKLATLIGGSIADEAKILERDVVCYLKNPQDKKLKAILKNHALRLEQETENL